MNSLLVVGVVVMAMLAVGGPVVGETGHQAGEAGATMDMSVSMLHELRPQPVSNDTGINVLIDHAHQMNFLGCWTWPAILREQGYRVVGSQASLDTVLNPGAPSRIRVPVGRMVRDEGEEGQAARPAPDWLPFGWWPNPEFNVVVTYQAQPDYQPYLPEEISSLKRFVEDGGGLVIVGGGLHSPERLAAWPLNALAREIGAAFTDQPTTYEGVRCPALKLDGEWNVELRGSDGSPIYATRDYGKGRIAILSEQGLLNPRNDAPEESPQYRANVAALFSRVVGWAAGGREPVGGTLRLPMEASGGGAIFPELELRLGSMVVYYARNQKPELLDVVRKSMPEVDRQVRAWMPSISPDGPMHFILSSGSGGGWAVNAYEPHEVGIIALEGEHILSIFAHELAHNLYSGPANEKGERAGVLPWVHSEAHAGWFQGKIGFMRTGEYGGHDPNRMFEIDEDGIGLDLATLPDSEHHKGWSKLWWVWQKLDDRYWPTWYPRWFWVKNMRWQDEPDRRLSWDDVVEDMSIAVGEDLFPFFRKIGTTLSKERFPSVEFRGERIELPVAPIEITPAGPARLEAIGDYTRPLERPDQF